MDAEMRVAGNVSIASDLVIEGNFTIPSMRKVITFPGMLTLDFDNRTISVPEDVDMNAAARALLDIMRGMIGAD